MSNSHSLINGLDDGHPREQLKPNKENYNYGETERTHRDKAVWSVSS